MFKKLMLSMLMISGSLCALDDAAGATNLIKESNNTEDATEYPNPLNSDFVRACADFSQEVLKKGFDAAKQLIQGESSLPAEELPTAPSELLEATTNGVKKIGDALMPDPNNSLTVLPEISVAPASDVSNTGTEGAIVRFAAIRNVWNSGSMQFACDMFNPYAHGRAWQAMWNAGFKAALPTLWESHTAVIAGTAVLTAVAVTAAYYAHKKGLLAKAKARALELKNLYFVSPV